MSFAEVNKLRLLAFKQYSYLLYNLVKKDFTTKYRRSMLGVLWSVLNPLLMMVVITSVFANIFRVQTENFAIYYLTGSMTFGFMSEATNGCLTSVIGSAGLIKKAYIPKYIFPAEKCFFALINTLFQFVAVLVLMPALGLPPKPTALLFWLPLLYVLIFSLGLGLILSSLTVFFRDIVHLYGVVVMAWMYLTPVIYPADLLPESMQWVLNINAMHYYVSYFRDIMMYGSIPSLYDNFVCICFALAYLLVGLIVFKKTQDRFVLYI